MSIAILRDSNSNSYFVYITSTTISVQKAISDEVVWQWTEAIAGSKSNVSATLDASNSVLFSYENSSGVAVWKINSIGTTVWQQQIGAPATNPSITCDVDNNLFVSVQTGSGTNHNIRVIKLSGSTGVFLIDPFATAITAADETVPVVAITEDTGLILTYMKDTPSTLSVVTRSITDNASLQWSQERTILTREAPVPCFLAGARVRTPGGWCAIERLRIGDRVLTASGAIQTIARVSVTPTLPGQRTNPFIIPRGYLGAQRRLLISPEHCIAIPGRGMVAAREAGLRQTTMREPFIYYNLELGAWENMIVEGVEVESLAPLRRINVTVPQLANIISRKYAEITPTIILNIIRTCRFIDDNTVSIPVLPKNIRR
jgi:hypothetical protein